MKFRIIKEEKGAVLPLVALFLIFVVFGMAALVVDAGTLYNTRKSMVTAADAGALAGAKEMEKVLGVTDAGQVSQIKANAIAIAKSLAIKNGAEGEPIVELTRMNVELADGSISNRDVIVVTVTKNEKHDFAQMVGFDNSDVQAQAVATWGYSRQVTGGQIFPLFMLVDSFEKGDTTLHENLVLEDGTPSPPNYGLINLEGDTKVPDMKKILSGENIDKQFIINQIMGSQTGNVQAIINSIETRMQSALTYGTMEERKSFMSGLIPIVYSEVVLPEIEDNSQAHINVRIEYFAVYTIHDVVKQNNNAIKGSPHALTTTDYVKVSEANTYEIDYPKGTIIGEFTGEIIELTTIIKDGDQDPLPEYEGLKRYSKLVK